MCTPNPQHQYHFLRTVADPYELTAKTYCLTQNNFQVGFKFCQRIHKAYRQVCCKEPLSFGWKITSLVSYGFAPFNLHCYGKPLDLDRAQNHWGHHNRVWQLPFSHLFGSKIKIPGKVNPGSIEISHTALETAGKSECLIRRGIHIDMNCTCICFKEKNWIHELVHYIQHEKCVFGRLEHVIKEQQQWVLAIFNVCLNIHNIINTDYLECSSNWTWHARKCLAVCG